MNPIHIVLFTILSYISLNQAASLPDFITPCKGTDPNLNECFEKEANKVIPILAKGYPSLNIPVLSPLKIQQVAVTNSGFNIVINDALVSGLEEAKISNVDVDLKKQYIKARLSIPNLNIQGVYEMSGQLLVLPLNGKGPCNITAVSGDYDVGTSYSLNEQDGVQYAKFETVDVEVDMKGAHFYFANLINNSKKVSDDINTVLNKEWRQILEDLKPAIKEAITLLALKIANGVFDKVPFAEIFGNQLP